MTTQQKEGLATLAAFEPMDHKEKTRGRRRS